MLLWLHDGFYAAVTQPEREARHAERVVREVNRQARQLQRLSVPLRALRFASVAPLRVQTPSCGDSLRSEMMGEPPIISAIALNFATRLISEKLP